MSQKQVSSAELKGWGAPHFPESLKALRLAQARYKISDWDRFREVVSKIPGFYHEDTPMTSDGYLWYRGYYFAHDGGQIAILFPWHHDRCSSDGDFSDRSLAVHVRGEVDLEKLISEFISAMKEVGLKHLMADLNDCDFGKVDGLIFTQFRSRAANFSFSGTIDEYVRYLCQKDLIGNNRVAVLIRIDDEKNWAKCDKTGMQVLSRVGKIWGALITFDSLVSLMKNKSIISIEN